MPHADFVHLRVHTAYSLSEGAIKLDALAALCAAQRMPAVAITDTGNLFGALEFSITLAAAGVQPIVGCQIGVRREQDQSSNGTPPAPDQLVLLVQNSEGYANLLKLVSTSYLATDSGEPAQISLTDLKDLNAGLLALTGGPQGAVGRLLREGHVPGAEAMLSRLGELFGDRLYVEVMRHGMPEEAQIETDLIDLAYRYNLPLVATNEAFFSDVEMFEAQDALLCISQGAYVSQRNRRRLTPDHRFKSAKEMGELFADLPEAISNTIVVAQRCSFMAETREPILPVFPKLHGRIEADVLRELAESGLENRLQAYVFTATMDEQACARAATPYRERLKRELDVIAETGFAGYFLIVADIIQWAFDAGIPVGPGRGSGAGSVVSWALTITDLDPLRWGLVFERFLNPERVTLPDFDLDFCMARRDEVIRYVQREYGEDRVAQIITFGKLQARAVLRDVGRVLEIPYNQVDRICKLVPNNPANPVSLQQAIDDEPALQSMRAEDETIARLIDTALHLEGLYRHASTHAAGVVIGDRPLDQLIPLYRDPRSDMPVTQFSMKYVELAGLVKFDFLGLKTLTVLRRTLDMLVERGIEIDLSKLPLDDAPTFQLLCEAETPGVFQMESSGMRDVLRKLRPDRFEDIIAVVALYRPGPMDNIPSYINRKHGREQPDYLHPSIEGILKETFGIMIYQEQVLQIAQALSGFTLGRADLLRRAMGKKIKKEMDAQNQAFVEGAVARGVEDAVASRIFDQVAKFAGYGFNKAHAAAYALVAYQTAYLKANHTVEFMAASMSYELGNTDKINTFKSDLERLNIRLLPPDINRSDAAFTVERTDTGEPAIRYALAALKNVGAAAMKCDVEEREKNGQFTDLFEFAERVDARMVNKRQLESLARAGAFDSLCDNRGQVFEAVEILIRHASLAQNDRESSQVSLFAGEIAAASQLALPDADDWPAEKRLQREFEAIGFYLSSHPIQSYAQACERLGVVSWLDIQNGRTPDGRIKIAGVVLGRRFTMSSRGSRMAFVQLSDASGSYEVTAFSEVLASDGELLESNSPLLITADVQTRQDIIRLTAQKIELLEEAAVQATARLKIFLETEDAIQRLANVIAQHGKEGRGHLDLILDIDVQEVEMSVPGTYAISPAIRSAIKAIPGIRDIHEV